MRNKFFFGVFVVIVVFVLFFVFFRGVGRAQSQNPNLSTYNRIVYSVSPAQNVEYGNSQYNNSGVENVSVAANTGNKNVVYTNYDGNYGNYQVDYNNQNVAYNDYVQDDVEYVNAHVGVQVADNVPAVTVGYTEVV